MWKSKKGFEFMTAWIWIWLFLAVMLGIVLGFDIANIWMHFVAVAFVALIIGHFIYTGKYGNCFPYYILGVGFILSYFIGLNLSERFNGVPSPNKLVLAVFFVVVIVV